LSQNHFTARWFPLIAPKSVNKPKAGKAFADIRAVVVDRASTTGLAVLAPLAVLFASVGNVENLAAERTASARTTYFGGFASDVLRSFVAIISKH
jgi:hypothetical protein